MKKDTANNSLFEWSSHLLFWDKMREDEKKLMSKLVPNEYDSHVFAYWKNYFPFVPTSHRAYVGQKQAC